MKRFLRLCTVYTLLIALLLLGLEVATRHIPNSYRYKTEWMNEHSNSIELLIMGNSHAYMGIDPSGFDMSAFSLANVSQPYRYDLFLLQKYIDDMTELKYVVLPVSYFSLYSGMEEGAEWWRSIYYHIYMDCDFHSDISKYGFEICHLSGAASRCISYYIKNEDMMQCSELGMSSAYSIDAKSTNWDNGDQRAELHTIANPENTSEKIYLEQIACLLNERGIELILVTMPARPSYRNSVNPMQMEAIYNEMMTLQNQYPNTTYLDMFDFEGLDDSDWFDSDHLSTLGATKIAEILQDSIKLQ